MPPTRLLGQCRATSMASFFGAKKATYDDVEFWHYPERCGWLMKQGASAMHVSRNCFHATTTCGGTHLVPSHVAVAAAQAST